MARGQQDFSCHASSWQQACTRAAAREPQGECANRAAGAGDRNRGGPGEAQGPCPGPLPSPESLMAAEAWAACWGLGCLLFCTTSDQPDTEQAVGRRGGQAGRGAALGTPLSLLPTSTPASRSPTLRAAIKLGGHNWIIQLLSLESCCLIKGDGRQSWEAGRTGREEGNPPALSGQPNSHGAGGRQQIGRGSCSLA